MTRLVWIDPNLFMHEDAFTRDTVIAEVRTGCKWGKGTILAEIPRLSSIRRMAAEKIPDGISSCRLYSTLEKIKSDQSSIRLAGAQGNTDEERALHEPLVEYLLTADNAKIGSPKYRDHADYFGNVPQHPTNCTGTSSAFRYQLDLLIVGSRRIDIVDQYMSVGNCSPLLLHLIEVFGPGGIHSKHLARRPELWLWLAERPGAKPPTFVDPNETKSGLLHRMGATALANIFNIVIVIWDHPSDEHHERLVLGDIGGLHLGSSLNSNAPTTVTLVHDPLVTRLNFQRHLERDEGWARILR